MNEKQFYKKYYGKSRFYFVMAQAEISEGYFKFIAHHKSRTFSYAVARRLEQASGGEMTMYELIPDMLPKNMDLYNKRVTIGRRLIREMNKKSSSRTKDS